MIIYSPNNNPTKETKSFSIESYLLNYFNKGKKKLIKLQLCIITNPFDLNK